MTARKPAEVLAEARQQKFDAWFKDRRWRVAEEFSGEREAPDPIRSGGPVLIKITYFHGQFWIDPPGRFHTPLGHAGSTGFVVAEVDAAGQDTGVKAAFGLTALKRAQERYGLITGLPEGIRTRPKADADGT